MSELAGNPQPQARWPPEMVWVLRSGLWELLSPGGSCMGITAITEAQPVPGWWSAAEEGGDIRIHKADSLYGTAEINTTL